MLAMPRSLTGVTMVMVLALALVALPLASAKLTIDPMNMKKTGMKRVHARMLQVWDGGSYRIDCSSGQGSMNYYADDQCRNLDVWSSRPLDTVFDCDDAECGKDDTALRCVDGTPKWVYYQNDGCTGDSIAGIEYIGTTCYTRAALETYVDEWRAKYERNEPGEILETLYFCGQSCPKPDYEVDNAYDACRFLTEARASGCMDDCASLPVRALKYTNDWLEICGAAAIGSGSATIKNFTRRVPEIEILRGGSVRIDCSYGQGTFNNYTDDQCRNLDRSRPLDDCDAECGRNVDIRCVDGTPKAVHYQNDGCTGSSIAGGEVMGTSCYDQADYDAYMANHKWAINVAGDVFPLLYFCGQSCPKPDYEVDSTYDACRFLTEARASGCMDDCASLPDDALARLDLQLEICGAAMFKSGSATIKTAFVAVAALAAVLINL